MPSALTRRRGQYLYLGDKIISGQIVAIIGASSGIGRASARRLASGGARVVLSARREEGLAQLTQENCAAGGQATYRVTDVSKRENLLELVQCAQQSYGRLDVLFSNAGTMPIGPFDDLAVDDWETMVDVNIKGVLFGIAAALPVFRQQGSGHFIHTASTAARKTVPNQVVYSATKAAVLAISDGLRQDLAGEIQVSTILPGFTDTAFSEDVKSAELRSQLEKAKEKFAMSPEAVASTVAYILEQPNDVNIGESPFDRKRSLDEYLYQPSKCVTQTATQSESGVASSSRCNSKAAVQSHSSVGSPGGAQVFVQAWVSKRALSPLRSFL